MATKQEVAALITLMEELYTHREKLSDGAVMLYQQALSDIPFDVLETAVKDHVTTSKWFPSIAELREKAMSYSVPQIPTAMEGWGEVQKEIRRTGYLGKPTFSNPVTARVVDALGWKYLCLSEDSMADRAHFLKAYEQVAARETREVIMLPEVRELAKRLTAGNK